MQKNNWDSLNRLTLKYELDIDFNLVAITSALKDYRLCFFINQATGMDLKKMDDYELPNGKGGGLYFSRYCFQCEDEETGYYLFGNRGLEGGMLIPEMKGTDFFFLAKQLIDEDQFDYYVKQINQLDEVLVAKTIEPAKLKSVENLIF